MILLSKAWTGLSDYQVDGQELGQLWPRLPSRFNEDGPLNCIWVSLCDALEYKVGPTSGPTLHNFADDDDPETRILIFLTAFRITDLDLDPSQM